MSQSRYSTVPSDAVNDERLSHVQLRVLLAIGSYTSKDKAGFPKQRTIAQLLGVSRETINRAIKVLRELGYVSVEHQKRDDGGQRESLYWVNLDPRDYSVTAPVIQDDPCDAEITPPVIAYAHTPRDHIGSHPRTAHKNITPEAKASVDAHASVPPLMLIPEQPNPQKGKSKVRGAARGSRLSETWAPTVADYAFAAKHNLTREEINREADRFRNYWCSTTGRNAVKLDWHRTWQNWLTGDYGIVTKRAGALNSGRNGIRPDAFDRLAERLSGGSDGPDAWQHDDPGTADGYVIDAGPARLAG